MTKGEGGATFRTGVTWQVLLELDWCFGSAVVEGPKSKKRFDMCTNPQDPLGDD
jgi:hypothetical protein